MKIAQIVVLSLFLHTVSAQIGLNFRYGDMNPQLWEAQSSTERLFASTYDIGIDYWFRLKNYRVEFMPEIYTSVSKTANESSEYRYTGYGLASNVNIYLFDFEGDCGCPTFSKDGNFITKGFYLSVAPFIQNNNKAEWSEGDTRTKVSSLSYGGSIGAGIDIGIRDLITLSPYIRYKFVPVDSWSGFQAANSSSIPDENINTSYIQVGLRLGFRPDYVREQNKFKKRRR